jgi:hypothetical protein
MKSQKYVAKSKNELVTVARDEISKNGWWKYKKLLSTIVKNSRVSVARDEIKKGRQKL